MSAAPYAKITIYFSKRLIHCCWFFHFFYTTFGNNKTNVCAIFTESLEEFIIANCVPGYAGDSSLAGQDQCTNYRDLDDENVILKKNNKLYLIMKRYLMTNVRLNSKMKGVIQSAGLILIIQSPAYPNISTEAK